MDMPSKQQDCNVRLFKQGKWEVCCLSSGQGPLWGTQHSYFFCLDIAKKICVIKAKKATMAIKIYKVFDANLTRPAILYSRLFD